MKPTKKWLKMAEVYKIFVLPGGNPDFSEKMAQEMFEFESTGKGNIEIDCFSSSHNGYANGKKWLNVTLSMWKEDIANGLLFKRELYEEPKYANVKWWLDEVLSTIMVKKSYVGCTNGDYWLFGFDENGKFKETKVIVNK
jgi:hypothetical protein